jgi:hypothetical protein
VLYLQKDLLVLISVRGRVNPRAIVWLEGLGKLKKNVMTSSGLEPMTFQNKYTHSHKHTKLQPDIQNFKAEVLSLNCDDWSIIHLPMQFLFMQIKVFLEHIFLSTEFTPVGALSTTRKMIRHASHAPIFFVTQSTLVLLQCLKSFQVCYQLFS